MTRETMTSLFMEGHGAAFGFISEPRSGLSIFYEEGTWVAYDEAGLEMARHNNYWTLRGVYKLYGQCLDMHRLPATGDTWKHHKGNEYEVLLLTNQFSDWMEYSTNVVYQGANGKVWSKGLGDFIEKMTFLRAAKDEQVECQYQETCFPPLGIKGMKPGAVYPGTDADDAAQADIDVHMEEHHGGGSDNYWHAKIHVNAQTPEKAAMLRDLVMRGLAEATNPAVLVVPPLSAEALNELAEATRKAQHQGLVMLLDQPLRDSLEFEALLTKYHSEVWEAAEREEDSRPSYDLAGVDTAKQLIAMYRGEAKYTHHNDLKEAVASDRTYRDGVRTGMAMGRANNEEEYERLISNLNKGIVESAVCDHNGEVFEIDQWWYKELVKVSLGEPIWADLVRACAVARNLAKATLTPFPKDQMYYPAPVTGMPDGEVPPLLEKGERVTQVCDKCNGNWTACDECKGKGVK